MNIAIIGYGKMGKMIEQIARRNGHTIAAIVDPAAPAPAQARIHKTIAEAEHLETADAAIEFTRPGEAAANIKALAEKQIPTVTGTTGWYGQLDEITKAVEAAGSALIWSANFSMGVNLFYRVAWYASTLMNAFPEFDAGGFETHHNQKLDSPSGTAKTLVAGVLSRLERKRAAVWETLNRRPDPGELHFPSLRIGSAPGKHSLFFDSPADTIEISHTARSREGFASGALKAAQWLAGPPARRGVFTIDEMLKDILEI
ncbi:MAG: 4-hydroxy-tetrahydrodipicolinate reductase [Treponema sp.]|jgi:4-hydroxy-tetrahydrodipicolinate reductase|nr:4-hydroxy-tetrahydrodipicolinate reductase [Treponema sp.]